MSQQSILFERDLRSAVLGGVQHVFGGSPQDLDAYRRPAGDPGLFGPGSLCWKLHADLPVMMIGGISALMLQTLHPLAMAGVDEHSLYRQDPIGRFRRTAAYVAGTTFGPMPLVEELTAVVQRVHERVHGVAPDGRPYSANDPQLLTWVHTCEVWSFLRANQRYGRRPLLRFEKDAYLGEVSVLARRLGALEVPSSLAEVRAYFRRIEPELHASPTARDAVRFLREPVRQPGPEGLAQRVLTEAAFDLLPGFAKAKLRQVPLVPGPVIRVTAISLSELLRWALGPSPVLEASTRRALQRVGPGPIGGAR